MLFVGKASAYPSRALYYLNQLLGLPKIIRLARKNVTGPNALAYLSGTTVKNKEKFYSIGTSGLLA
jgi:hypothetical protein